MEHPYKTDDDGAKQDSEYRSDCKPRETFTKITFSCSLLIVKPTYIAESTTVKKSDRSKHTSDVMFEEIFVPH